MTSLTPNNRWAVGTPLAAGRLAGGKFYGQEDTSPTAAKVGEIERIAAKFGVDIKAAALQFPLAHPRVACVIPGASNVSRPCPFFAVHVD
jgi:D-threo-aldose 1-dehydrogenase